MRRLQIEASLVVLWLLASGVHGYASGPAKVERKGTAAKTTKEKVFFAREIAGWGESIEDAEQDALKRAREEIKQYFVDQGISLSWRPSVEYVYGNFIKGLKKTETKEMPGVGTVREVRLQVEISDRDYGEILHQDRQFVSQNRMLNLGKWLVGLVALLAVVAGYFRLEEATKGYYTTWLRLGTLGFVAVVGAGIWLMS